MAEATKVKGAMEVTHGNRIKYVRFEVFMVVTMKKVSSGMLRHVALVRTDPTLLPKLGTSLCLGPFTTNPTFPPPPLCIHYSEFHSSFLSNLVFLRSVRRLLVTASVFPSSPILVTLMKEALRSSETSVLTRAT
jgi:hypothetical protein